MSAFFVNLASDGGDRVLARSATTLPRGSRGGQKDGKGLVGRRLAEKKRGIALPTGASLRPAPFGTDQGSLQTLTDPEAPLESLQRLGRGCDPRFDSCMLHGAGQPRASSLTTDLLIAYSPLVSLLHSRVCDANATDDYQNSNA
jgi:hypothetical protein